MTNSQGMKNSMINASTSFAAGLVVDAANAHRSYLPGVERPCVADRIVLRPDLGSPCTKPQPCSTLTPSDTADSKQSQMRRETQERGRGRGREHETLRSRFEGCWRLDASHQLPTPAWAMLVLSRSISG